MSSLICTYRWFRFILTNEPDPFCRTSSKRFECLLLSTIWRAVVTTKIIDDIQKLRCHLVEVLNSPCITKPMKICKLEVIEGQPKLQRTSSDSFLIALPIFHRSC